MALKAIIYKAQLQLSDIDRNVYADHEITIARHPSETDERMLVRLLVYALNAPTESGDSIFESAKDMWNADEPALWEKDLTGQLQHWIEVGQPDDRRIMQASSRADRVSVYSFASSTGQWWSGLADKLTRARNLTIWQIPAAQSQSLAGLADRTMRLDITVQDGTIWVGNGQQSVEISPTRLFTTAK